MKNKEINTWVFLNSSKAQFYPKSNLPVVSETNPTKLGESASWLMWAAQHFSLLYHVGIENFVYVDVSTYFISLFIIYLLRPLGWVVTLERCATVSLPQTETAPAACWCPRGQRPQLPVSVQFSINKLVSLSNRLSGRCLCAVAVCKLREEKNHLVISSLSLRRFQQTVKLGCIIHVLFSLSHCLFTPS